MGLPPMSSVRLPGGSDRLMPSRPEEPSWNEYERLATSIVGACSGELPLACGIREAGVTVK